MKKDTPSYQSVTEVVEMLVEDIRALHLNVKQHKRSLTLEEIRGLQAATKTIIEASEFTEEKTKKALKKKSTDELRALLKGHPAAKAMLKEDDDE